METEVLELLETLQARLPRFDMVRLMGDYYQEMDAEGEGECSSTDSRSLVYRRESRAWLVGLAVGFS